MLHVHSTNIMGIFWIMVLLFTHCTYKYANWPRAKWMKCTQGDRKKHERIKLKYRVCRIHFTVDATTKTTTTTASICTRHVATLCETCFSHGQCSKKRTVTKLHWLYLIFAIYLRNSIFFFCTTSFARFFFWLLCVCVCIGVCVWLWTIFIPPTRRPYTPASTLCAICH